MSMYRKRELGFVRAMKKQEQLFVYTMLYQEWGRGISKGEFFHFCRKQDEKGVRYVYLNQHNRIVSTMLLIPLTLTIFSSPSTLYGISSLYTFPQYRKQGYASNLLNNVIANKESLQEYCTFFLYADISPAYYKKLEFKEVPGHLQRYSSSVLMIKAHSNIFQELFFLRKEQMPSFDMNKS
ncbi:hypothetical protein CN918_31545 [Priestia megaterium]|nr:hypothetical protein CN918_31545 [Priestia megaterium]